MIEFMIAMTIGLFMLSGLSFLMAQTSQSRRELESTSRQIESARYSLERIGEEIRLAGFFGDYSSLAQAGATGFPASVPSNPCTTTLATITSDLPVLVQGYDGAVSSPLSGCIANADYKAGTDILVVRRALTQTTALASLAANTIYHQGAALEQVLGTSANTSVFTLTRLSGNGATNGTATTAADIRRLVVRIFYVSPCNVPASGTSCTGGADDGGTPIPTLKMLDLGAGASAPAFNVVALAEGVEQVQFDYGIDSDSDGAPNSFTTCGSATPCAAADWGNVVAIRVSVLARNTDLTAGYVNDKTFNMGMAGMVGPFNDNYRRHAYSSIVRVINNSMRREK